MSALSNHSLPGVLALRRIGLRPALCAAWVGVYSVSGATALAQVPARPVAPAAPATPVTFEPNQTVEAREGDTWSPATVVAKEGRKIQIKYADGTLEWVTVDRLRAAGAKPATSAPATPAPAAPGVPAPAGTAPGTPTPPAGGPAKPAQKEQFALGSKIEFKSLSWKKGTVKNRDGDLYLIIPDGWEKQFFWQWVHISMVRNVGDTAKEGPDHQSGVTIGNKSIVQAKADAAKQFAGLDKEMEKKQAERDADSKALATTPSDPWAPEPFDKPPVVPNLTGIQQKAIGGPAGKIPNTGVLTRSAGGPVAVAAKPDIFYQSKLLFGDSSLLHVTSRPRFGGKPKRIRIERINLATSVNEGLIEWDKGSEPIAVSRTGDRVLAGTSSSSSFGNDYARLDLWSLSGTPPVAQHLVSFSPYPSAGKDGPVVEWATLPDNDHVLTCSKQGELIAWSIAANQVKGIWRTNVRNAREIAISPDRKLLAAQLDSGMALIDTATGATVAVLDGNRTLTSMQFTGDGKHLVGVGPAVVYVWDLEKGTFAGDIGLPAELKVTTLLPGRDGFVEMGGWVLDVNSRQVVWSFAGATKMTAAFGGRLWALIDQPGVNKTSTIVSTDFPSAAISNAAKASAANPQSVLRSGSKVSLEVNLDGTEAQIKAATAAITADLKRSGITIADGQPVKVVLRTEDGQSKEMVFSRFGGFREAGEKVSVVEKISRLYVEADGKTVWETRTMAIPSFIQLKQNESVSDAVAAANKPNLRFFEFAHVPNFIPKPREAAELGKSTWTATGIRD